MLDRRVAIAFAAGLSSATAGAAAIDRVTAQIRTVEIPPSLPAPMLPSPGAPAPDNGDTDGLELDLPTIDEARAIDADSAAAVDIDADAAARAMAAAEALRLRAANTEQLAAARAQLDRIASDQRAERDRLARYREAEAAHAAAMADYTARLEAARVAREQWERDVAACQAGNRDRCGPPVAAN